jgi:oligopeptide/dipeptide ABC transporter ATP-binding protein
MRAPVTDAVLSVDELRVQIVGRDGERVVRAVDGVSFEVGAAETVGIVGESGSGKTMTSLALTRLLPKGARIAGGRAVFAGEDLLQKSEAEMRRLRGQQISMILQDPMVALDPLYTIGEQLAEPLRIHRRLKAKQIRERSIELLASVGISSPEQRLSQHPHQMSGGMLQRIVGAIAISCDPRLLIADEPTTALDPTVQAQFLDLLEELQQAKRLALIIVTHDFGVAARLCARVFVMYAGCIVEQGTVRQIFDNPRHPYTQALLASIPGARENTGKRLRTIEGQPPDLGALPRGCAFAARCPQAMPRCRAEAPPDLVVEDRHSARCWLVELQ